MAVTVYLADLAKGVEYPSPVRITIQNLFDQATGPGTKVTVQWTRNKPRLGDNDLLVYFVDDAGDSVLVTGMAKGDKPESGSNGWTKFGSGTLVGSEVYVSGHRTNSSGLGRLAVHELMHNMSLKGESMHHPGMSIGAKTMKPDAVLSDGDKKLINKHLTATKRKQWSDGFSHYYDPSRGSF